MVLDGSPALVLILSVVEDCSESELLSLELLSCLAWDILALWKGFCLCRVNVPPCVPKAKVSLHNLSRHQLITSADYLFIIGKNLRTLMTVADERRCVISIGITVISHNLFVSRENFPFANGTNPSIFRQPRIDTF